MTARKVRKGSVRTIREDAAEPVLVLASNRRFFRGEQCAQDRLVEAHADGPILGEGYGPGSRALGLADVLATGPADLGALGPARAGEVRGEQRGVAQGARIGGGAWIGNDDVRSLHPAGMQPEIVPARRPEQVVVVTRAAADQDARSARRGECTVRNARLRSPRTRGRLLPRRRARFRFHGAQALGVADRSGALEERLNGSERRRNFRAPGRDAGKRSRVALRTLEPALRVFPGGERRLELQ